MDSFDTLPLAAGVSLHAAGVMVACLSRLSFGSTVNLVVRVALLAMAVMISGLAMQSAQYGFSSWAFSALTLGAMVILAVLHGQHVEQDPVLYRVVSARR